MRIALINASPKSGPSASEGILKSLKALLSEGDELNEISMRTPMVTEDDLVRLSGCDVLVFAFPLYVDSIPAHLLGCMVQMETFFKTGQSDGTTVYALVNCGFYEGKQNVIAIDIMKSWTLKSNLAWGQGLGIGGGGMLSSISNVADGQGPKKNFGEAMKVIARNIDSRASGEPLYISPNFPRFAYKLGAEMGWRQQIKSNGLMRKDLDRRPESDDRA